MEKKGSKFMTILLALSLAAASVSISFIVMNKDAILVVIKEMNEVKEKKPEELMLDPAYLKTIKEEIEERNKSLAEREKQLEDKEKAVERLTAYLDQEKVKLESMREEFGRFFSVVSENEMKNISKLAKAYGAMKPDRVVRILDEMDDDLVVVIFSKMKPGQTAKILELYAAVKDASGIDRAKRTARLTEKMKEFNLIIKQKNGVS